MLCLWALIQLYLKLYYVIWGALATQNHRGCESRAIFSAGFQPEPAEFRSAWLLDRSADRLTEGFQRESAEFRSAWLLDRSADRFTEVC